MDNIRQKTKVVTFSGKAMAGKDFSANIMKELLEAKDKKVLITHYADLLKYMCTKFFEWDGQKDEKGRTLLQYVGTDVIRKQMPNFWVDFICKVLELFTHEWDYVLIPDCRFPNEIECMKSNNSFDTYSVHVDRPGFKSSLTLEQQMHPSETALDDYKFDFYLVNTLEPETRERIVHLLDKIEKPRPTAYIDLDSCAINTVRCVNELYQEDYCYYSDFERIPWQNIKTWDFLELRAAKPEHLNNYFNQPRFFKKVKMMPWAKETIDQLSKHFNIVFVSHGFSPNIRLKKEWVPKHFPYAEFIGVNLKEHEDKSCVDMSGEGNIFIDDSPKNLESSNAPIKILFGEDMEWNKDYKPKDGIIKCQSWVDIYNTVMGNYCD